MPIEIRELVIKTTINDDAQQAQSGDLGAASEGNNGVDQNTALVNLIVEKVLELIKEKSER
ncbi:MAG: hypothetical protein JNJ57_15705 [Saprospiraceae bacterium]|nr:hypothetical protein [Saprospiraceae bacterium]